MSLAFETEVFFFFLKIFRNTFVPEISMALKDSVENTWKNNWERGRGMYKYL